MASTTRRRVVLVLQARSYIFAPKHDERTMAWIMYKRDLFTKYGDLASHLDNAFMPIHCPIHNRLEPALDGFAIRGAINDWVINKIVAARGENPQVYRNFNVIGAFTFEEFVLVNKKKIESQQSLMVFEYIPPDAYIHVVMDANEKLIELLKQLAQTGFEIQLGWARRSKGTGRAVLVAVMDTAEYLKFEKEKVLPEMEKWRKFMEEYVSSRKRKKKQMSLKTNSKAITPPISTNRVGVTQWLHEHSYLTTKQLSARSGISERLIIKWKIEYDVIDVYDKKLLKAWIQYKDYTLRETAILLGLTEKQFRKILKEYNITDRI